MGGDLFSTRSTDGPAAASVDPVVRVGVDLVVVADVQESVERLGERYLSRLFTEHERDTCRASRGFSADSLAARFAAKEAALKVLRPGPCRPEWRDIEVSRNGDGSCDLRLHGEAAALAAAQGIGYLSVSMSHEAGFAVAVVVATCRPSCDRSPVTGAQREQREQWTERALART